MNDRTRISNLSASQPPREEQLLKRPCTCYRQTAETAVGAVRTADLSTLPDVELV